MKRNISFLLPLCIVALTSCETMNDSWDSVWGGDDKPIGAKSSGCPQVAVLRDLSIYQNPPAADESSLIYTARMGNIRGNCSVDETGITVRASAELAALRGVNGTSGSVTLPFFVSVLDATDNIVSKKSYDVGLSFENSSRQTRVTIPIEPRIALAPGQDGATYRVLVGFELSADQVDSNTRFFSQTPVDK
jgi:hypothetical protein